MPDGYQIYNQQGLYYLTFQIVDWVDIFTRQIYRDILIDSFKYCIENKGLELYAFVIMSNHVHLICKVAEEHDLSAVVRDFKRHTSNAILDSIQENPKESRRHWLLYLFSNAASRHHRNKKYQVWTHENHAVELESNSFTAIKLNYIHQNPVRAGYVDCAEDWLYSSARNYAGMQGLLDVILIG